MDIQEEKEAFLNVYVNYKGDSRKISFSEETEQFMWRKNNVSDTEVEYVHLMNQQWYAWLACVKSKAQAVPEWINVHLLSPQIDTEVLICVDDDVQLAVWRVDDCGGYFEDAIGEIKWWMPLPKAQEPANG